MVLGVGAACSGDGDPIEPAPARLDVSPAGEQRLFSIGATVQLSATPKDEAGNTVAAQVTWSSDNTAVATVSSSGLVTATGFGTTKVRATAGGVSQEVIIIVSQAQFNVNATSPCSNPDLRSFKVEHQSAHLLIVSDVSNPPGGFTTQDYEGFAATFESLVWPVLTQNFGTPADIDGNGRVIAFFTRAVNELTPANSQSVVGGFFFGRDLFPKIATQRLPACASSNEAEMFYMLVPDPTGVVNQNPRSLETVRRLTIGVIGHEFQHLINASRRIFVNNASFFEVPYMEEGLSHIAEELLFYEASGLAPRQNIGIETIRQSDARRDAFNSYMISNAGRFSTYLKDPSNNAPYEKGDDLATRGASWSFLRYLADRGTAGPFTEPACGNPVSLTVGGRCRIENSSATQFNVAAGGSAGEFTIVAFAADLAAVQSGTDSDGKPVFRDGTMSTTASATSAIAVSGPPNPWLDAVGPRFSSFGGSVGGLATPVRHDVAFHARLRALERRHLTERIPGARAAFAAKAALRPRTFSAAETGPLMAHVPIEPVWSQLVNTKDSGIVNLRARFGADITGAARDWAVAHYVDDIGLTVPPQYTHPSWNFRTVLPALSSNGAVQGGAPGTYPLQVHVLTQPVTLQMTNAGAAYYRLGVAAGTTSTVTFTASNGGSVGNLRLVLVRTK